ncbi:MAG TPA: hypothetical protein VK622_08360 [Puia sp.]|nr:hypothetical protein [Puia sp.]
METPNIWEHEYTRDGQKKQYKTELINYNVDDYDPDNPSVFKNIQTELDKKLNDFLDAYHINPLIPMRVDVSGKPFKISMGESDSILIEKLEEDKGPHGYGRV